MSSGSKKKADLVALFRLEFYRKQSNWKFCSQVQKAKKAESKDKATCTTEIVKDDHEFEHEEHVKCLNKTYNVDTKKDSEESIFNEAFLEADDDKNLLSLQNSPQTPTKDWSPKVIKIADKWSPPGSASLNDTDNIHPDSEKPALTGAGLELSKPGLNLTGEVDNMVWLQETGGQKQSWQLADQNWEQFWPYPTQDQNYLDVNYQNTQTQEKYNEDKLQETKFSQTWLQPELKYEGLENNPQNCQNIAKEQNWPQNERKVMRSWADLHLNQNNDKQVQINNISVKQDTDWPKIKTPEPVYPNWYTWKETQVASDMAQNLQQNWPGLVWQNNTQWQGREQELPELDKEGQEGTEAGWPCESQIWTNNQQHPEDIWSDDVLRELELLNINELDPEVPAEAEKWVPPDKLLQWMLANKECYDDVFESSCDSLEQFMRAAHCAPHSTEVDLQPQLDALEASIEAREAVGGAQAVGAWSWAALRAVGRGHARALRRVARELRARERLVGNRDLSSRSAYPSTPTPRYDVSCEEYPTRDIGLQLPASIDTFISGSYKNDPNNKLLEKNKDLDEKMHEHVNEGLIHLQGGRIVARGQSETERGQMERNRGLMEPNNQVLQSWGQMEPKPWQTGKLRVQGDQIVIDTCDVSPDQTQPGLEYQKNDVWGGFGDHELIGRGRGRLPVKEMRFSAGRGRGRL